MTKTYEELMEQVDRMEIFLAVIIGLFTIALIATAFLLFWPFKDEEGDEG